MNYIDLETQLTQAEEYSIASNFDEAERIAKEVLAELDNPSHALQARETATLRAKSTLRLATIARRHGNSEQALELACVALELAAEHNLQDIKPKAWNTCGLVYTSLGDYYKSLDYFDKALLAFEELGEKFFVANVTGNIGNVYRDLGNYSKALEYYTKALVAHEKLSTKSGVATVTGNIGIVFANIASYDKALEYFDKALADHEELGEKSGVANITGNIGNVYFVLGNYDKALEYYAKALATHEELGEKSGIARVTGNIGLVYQKLASYDKALEYYTKALSTHEKIGEKSGIARGIEHIGALYAEKKNEFYNAAKAEEYLLQAVALSGDIKAKGLLVEQYNTLADLYRTEKRWEDADRCFQMFYEFEKEVKSEEAKKTAEKQDRQRKDAEREKQIEITLATAAANLTATTALLHRVLPESIATRMIAGEQDIADYFPTVTILFADIAGFTPISAGIPAYMVVRFLNYVFGRFDVIMKKHGCEKIKTIGDGYMAVAGAPIPCDDHAERMALAALEMQQDIRLPDEFKEYLSDGVEFGIRVGLHTGSVVGGVIGDERFVYDIYSDSVNTAARMESHGEPDKIHVSHEYYIHLQNRFAMTKNTTHGITFEKRGEMNIKGKGLMKTYFLENRSKR